MNAAGTEYGRGRLAHVVRGHWQASASELIRAIFRDLDQFSTTPFDDQTVLVMKVK
jgi:serine phosphatase RsbU (regulator of sigma subunit)